MNRTWYVCWLLVGLGLAEPAVIRPQSPSTGNAGESAAVKGVACPADHETLYDASTKVLRCRREAVAWVVTRCAEKEFSAYQAKPGLDSCGPTEIPGVGTPPGASGSRPVVCASVGYAVVPDRTGPRDRCERVDRTYALPRPVP